MSDNNIKSEIINFYNDPLYQELNAYYSKKTIFNILKIERNENRHSAFLAWLLDVKGSHGLGNEPLMKFMRLLAMKDNKYNNPFLVGEYHIENMEVEPERYANAEKYKKTGRVDIDLEFGYTLNKDDKPKFVHVVLENKVYSKEHGDQTDVYHKWAVEENEKSKKNKWIIGVFLSPELTENCAGDTDGFEYVKLTYDDVLKYILEPLFALEMSNETRVLLTDYVINLGQPVRSKNDVENEKDKKGNEDTILAVSNSNKSRFIEIYDNHRTLLDASLYLVNCNKKEQLKIVFGKKGFDKAILADNETLLNDFWEANKRMLRMVLNTALKTDANMYKYLKEGADEDDESKYKDAVDALLNLKKSSRDTTKYLVYVKNGKDRVLMNEVCKGRPVFMSIASFFIFKAWLLKNEGASLNDIRKAFSVDACAKHYSNTYQYLFYKKEDVENAIKNNTNRHDYAIAQMDENDPNTIDKNKYLKWDFFIGKNAQKYCFALNGVEVLSIKMWHKEEFIELAKFAKENYGIEVVAKGK